MPFVLCMGSQLNGYWLPTTLASSIYIINSGIVLWRLPPNELPPAVQRAASSLTGEAASASRKQLLPRITLLARPRVAALFTVRALLGLAIQVFRQGFQARLVYSFNLSVQANGLLLSYQVHLSCTPTSHHGLSPQWSCWKANPPFLSYQACLPGVARVNPTH